MRILLLILSVLMLVGCGKTDDDAIVNPSLIQVYPDEEITLSTSEVFGVRQTSNGNFLMFAIATNFRSEPEQISITQLASNGSFINRTYITEVNAYSTNILGENGGDEFEILCSPVTTDEDQVLLKVSLQGEEINTRKQTFELDCLLEDCGMIMHTLKRGDSYFMLNIGVDEIQGTKFSKVYIHQMNTTNLTNQFQISEQNFNPQSVLGLTEGNYQGLLPYRDLFFIEDVNGQLLYHAPREERLALRYLNTENQNLYTSEFFFLSDFQRNLMSNTYGTIFQDRTEALPPHETFVMPDFSLQNNQDTGEIEKVIFLEDASACIGCVFPDIRNPLPNINPQNKVIIRYDEQGKMYIGATSQTGQTVIYDMSNIPPIPYTFGSGNPQYELADFLITSNQIIVVGLTTLQINRDNSVLNGKRAPFVIVFPVEGIKIKPA